MCTHLLAAAAESVSVAGMQTDKQENSLSLTHSLCLAWAAPLVLRPKKKEASKQLEQKVEQSCDAVGDGGRSQLTALRGTGAGQIWVDCYKTATRCICSESLHWCEPGTSLPLHHLQCSELFAVILWLRLTEYWSVFVYSKKTVSSTKIFVGAGSRSCFMTSL